MLRSVQCTYGIEECSIIDLSSQIHDPDFRIEAPHYGAPNWASVTSRQEQAPVNASDYLAVARKLYFSQLLNEFYGSSFVELFAPRMNFRLGT